MSVGYCLSFFVFFFCFLWPFFPLSWSFFPIRLLFLFNPNMCWSLLDSMLFFTFLFLHSYLYLILHVYGYSMIFNRIFRILLVAYLSICVIYFSVFWIADYHCSWVAFSVLLLHWRHGRKINIKYYDQIQSDGHFNRTD